MTGYVNLTIAKSGIFSTGADQKIKDQLHADSANLGVILGLLVEARTPVDTGGLLSDITFDPNPGGDDIVLIYAGDTGQMASWNRIYVQYQEGPPLGVSTYTNPPRNMFQFTATTDGLVATETWAIENVLVALA
jgi:hypothetical protein